MFLLDIEGTICPIAFVKKALFPYFLAHVGEYVGEGEGSVDGSTSKSRSRGSANSGQSEAVAKIVAQFPHQPSRQALLDYIASLVHNDVKDTTLKALQGFVWADGYNKGELKVPLYEDAIVAIKRWAQSEGVSIYSSGSVKAQKLLLGHVEGEGDLNQYVSHYFDTVNAGNKKSAESYRRIVDVLGTADITFLSDNVEEVAAAREAGMRAKWVVRPGNPEVETDLEAIKDFGGL